MITIKQSKNADSRTMVGEPNKEELLYNSLQHIGDVRQAMMFFANMLWAAGQKHDYTKITDIDGFFDSYSKKLTGDAFKAEPWYQLHLTERHHLNDRCPDDVNLIDVLERVSDITMAGMARSGNIMDVEISDEILQKAYKNTINMLKQNIRVEE